MAGYAPKPITLEYVDTADYSGIKPQPFLVVGDSQGEAQGIQSLSVGAMMELETDGQYSEQSPFLRVKDSGTVQVLVNQPANGSLQVHGHRYGRAVTVYVRLAQTNTGLNWSLADLGDDFFLGAPEIATETLVPIYNAAGNAVQANLHVKINPSTGVSFTLIGTANTTGFYADWSFSFVTPDTWPDNVPYDAPTGTTTLDYTTAPTVMHITHAGPADHNVGAPGSFDATTDQTPDGAVTLHMSINGGEPYALTMTHDTGLNWYYDYPNGLYYGYPSLDYQDEITTWVTAAYQGRMFTSNTVTFEGE